LKKEVITISVRTWKAGAMFRSKNPSGIGKPSLLIFQRLDVTIDKFFPFFDKRI